MAAKLLFEFLLPAIGAIILSWYLWKLWFRKLMPKHIQSYLDLKKEARKQSHKLNKE